MYMYARARAHQRRAGTQRAAMFGVHVYVEWWYRIKSLQCCVRKIQLRNLCHTCHPTFSALDLKTGHHELPLRRLLYASSDRYLLDRANSHSSCKISGAMTGFAGISLPLSILSAMYCSHNTHSISAQTMRQK